MPANPDYLTRSLPQRVAKLSAAIIGSLLITAISLLAIAVWFDNPKRVFFTYLYAFPLLWCTLMLLAFRFDNGWRCWALYGGLILLGLAVFFFGYVYHPSH